MLKAAGWQLTNSGLVAILALVGACVVACARPVPSEFSGEYLVFGWAPNADPVHEYPAYVGHATIRRVGSTWEMTQRRGQKVLGISKEVSKAVGTATGSTISFGWSEPVVDADADPSKAMQYGAAEYTKVDDNTLVGPWVGYEDSGIGFEELVKIESAVGYYVNLHTPRQKQFRKKVVSMYANLEGRRDGLGIEGWMTGSKRTAVPNYSGQGVVVAKEGVIRFVSSFTSESGFRKSVGILGSDNHLSMGWATLNGDWGSSRFEATENVWDGVWTKYGFPDVGYEQISMSTTPS